MFFALTFKQNKPVQLTLQFICGAYLHNITSQKLLVIIKQKGIPAFINVILIHWIIICLFDLFISSFQNVPACSFNDRP